MALKVFDAVPDLAQGLATQNADFIRKNPEGEVLDRCGGYRLRCLPQSRRGSYHLSSGYHLRCLRQSCLGSYQFTVEGQLDQVRLWL